MALVVEDDTGLANADSYVTLAAFKTYCASWGHDITGVLDPALEVGLRKGFQYVNANWRYKSTPKTNSQSGEFPRIDLSDGMGRIFNTVPQRVKDAQCEAAFVALSEDLFSNLDRGGKIASETVGPVSTSYTPDAPAEKLFSAVDRLVGVFVRDPNKPRRPLPSWSQDQEPVFTMGMNDTPGAC